MIIIKQLLNEIMDNKDDNIASIDNHREWRWSDVDHLINMKFIQSGNYFLLNKQTQKLLIYLTKLPICN